MAKEVVERAAYLRGLIEGIGIGDDDRYGRIVREMADVLSAVARAVDDLENRQAEAESRIDAIDEDLAEVEDDLYDEEDDEYVDIECPHCKETICFDSDLLEDDAELCCPNCGGVIFSSDDEHDKEDGGSGETGSN